MYAHFVIALRVLILISMNFQKVGHVPEVVRGRSKLTRNELDNIDTFRHPPEGQESFPIFSAPIGPRAILAEVRAPPPPRTMLATTYGLDEDNQDSTPTLASAALKPIATPAKKSIGGTMSKGGVDFAQVDQLAWLASVKVGSKRESHSSETRSRVRSSLNPQSRPPSGPERSGSSIGVRQRSGSLSRAAGDERRDEDEGQSLQDEFVSKLLFSLVFMLMFPRITTVLTKLSASKITLEKVGLSLLSLGLSLSYSIYSMI
jgi:hypothetical protein